MHTLTYDPSTFSTVVLVGHLSQDYLETKRIAFPRFYFVAPADLLDILSKGSNPQLILRHLSKCFDNVHNLSFKKDDRADPTKV